MSIPAELVQRDRQLLNRVSSLAATTATNSLPDLSKLSQNEAGGVLRTLATGTVTSIGEVATQSARISYDDMAAAAVGESAFKASTLKNLAESVVESVDPIVGFSMEKYGQGLFVESASFFAAGISRAVANAYRDTMIQNSNSDSRVSRYQRVASASACAFCAFAAATADVTTADAHKFHDHCSCSIVSVFKGQEEYRPDYYAQYDEDAQAAMSKIRAKDAADRKAFRAANPEAKKRDYFRAYPQNALTTKNILMQMRASAGYK